MDKAYKKQLSLVAFGVILFVALSNLKYVVRLSKFCLNLLAPVLYGFLLAFVFSVPVRALARRLCRLMPNSSDRKIDIISLILTLICVITVIVLLCVIAVPQLAASVKSIADLGHEKWPYWLELLQSYGIDTNGLTNMITSSDWKSLLKNILNGFDIVIGSVASVAGSTISAVANAAVSFVIALYILIGWRELGSQCRRAMYAYCRKNIADRICHIAKLAHSTYARFLSGQCVEVVILGILIFVSLSVAGIPYAGLTAVLTAVFAFIPYIGAFLSCLLGVLFTMLAAPDKALLCLIVYQAAQFVENQFIYPHVVGNSVGLSPFWTLLAVLIGGKLFGILGMIFFIPIMALIAQLLQESISKRLDVRSESDGEAGTKAAENQHISNCFRKN